MTWRYQTIWHKYEGDRAYSLCEVYLNEDGRLDYWTQNPAIAPGSDTWEGLQRDIGRMYEACWNWEPVAAAELQAGMTFKRRLGSNLARLDATTEEEIARHMIEDDTPELTDEQIAEMEIWEGNKFIRRVGQPKDKPGDPDA